MNAQSRLLPYSTLLDSRNPDDIDLLVVHCTELPDLTTARTYGERIHYPESGTGNSGHYYIDRNGHIEQWAPENRVAHHVRAYNHRSIGVELVNTGRYPDWFHSEKQEMSEAYPQDQIDAFCALVRSLTARLSHLQFIAGHEDLDTGTVAASNNPSHQIRRKRDPGPLFPWPEVLSATGLERLIPGN